MPIAANMKATSILAKPASASSLGPWMITRYIGSMTRKAKISRDQNLPSLAARASVQSVSAQARSTISTARFSPAKPSVPSTFNPISCGLRLISTTVRGKRRTNTHTASTVNAVRQPAAPITYCVRGTNANVPNPMPETAIPLARPRFFWNQWESTAE